MKFPFSLFLLLFLGCTLLRAEETVIGDPLDPPQILRPVPEKYSDSQRLWQGITSMEATSSERLWATWYSGGTTEGKDNYVLLATSGDAGETWTEPILAIETEGLTHAFDPGMWMDPTGRLWFFWTQSRFCVEGTNQIWDGRGGVWCMTTENPEAGEDAVWSTPRRLFDGVMLGKPIVDSQNRWIFPAAGWSAAGPFTLPEGHKGAALWVTTDQGQSFQFLGCSAISDEIVSFAEHQILEMNDGTFKIYARILSGIGEAQSEDGGKTWTDIAPSKTLRNTSARFFMRRLRSGNILLVKNGPADQDVDRSRMTAMISTDEGKTWSDGLVLDERPRVSYPDGNQTADGTIFIIYDHGRYEKDEREVCAARFTEEDVLAGKLVTPGSKLKLLVNKATGELK